MSKALSRVQPNGGSSNTMATWCEEPTHLKRPWCWEGLRTGGEGDDRGWDGWMASPTRWTWVCVDSGSWWWTGRPGMLRFMGLQRVRHDWLTELNWYVPNILLGTRDMAINKADKNSYPCWACWPLVILYVWTQWKLYQETVPILQMRLLGPREFKKLVWDYKVVDPGFELGPSDTWVIETLIINLNKFVLCLGIQGRN